VFNPRLKIIGHPSRLAPAPFRGAALPPSPPSPPRRISHVGVEVTRLIIFFAINQNETPHVVSYKEKSFYHAPLPE
jgi:hypothetical protein